MASENNVHVSVSTQPNSECSHDTVQKKTSSSVSDVHKKGRQKTVLNCILSDEAVGWLERAIVTVVIASMVVLLSFPSAIYLVSYHKRINKGVCKIGNVRVASITKYGNTS